MAGYPASIRIVARYQTTVLQFLEKVNKREIHVEKLVGGDVSTNGTPTMKGRILSSLIVLHVICVVVRIRYVKKIIVREKLERLREG